MMLHEPVSMIGALLMSLIISRPFNAVHLDNLLI